PIRRMISPTANSAAVARCRTLPIRRLRAESVPTNSLFRGNDSLRPVSALKATFHRAKVLLNPGQEAGDKSQRTALGSRQKATRCPRRQRLAVVPKEFSQRRSELPYGKRPDIHREAVTTIEASASRPTLTGEFPISLGVVSTRFGEPSAEPAG